MDKNCASENSEIPAESPNQGANANSIQPTIDDILLRSGEDSQRNPGNVRFHKASESMASMFKEAADRQAKHDVAVRLANVVRGWNGRFLDFDNSTSMWTEISERRAIRKCLAELRHKTDGTLSGDTTEQSTEDEGSTSSSTSAASPNFTPREPKKCAAASIDTKRGAKVNGLPKPRQMDPPLRTDSLTRFFQSIESTQQVFASKDSVTEFLMSQPGLLLELPPLSVGPQAEENEQERPQLPVGSQAEEDEEEQATSEDPTFPKDEQIEQQAVAFAESQTVLIQDLLRSVRAAQSAALGQGSSHNTEGQDACVGFFASRDWGTDPLGSVQDVDFQQVFRSIAQQQQQEEEEQQQQEDGPADQQQRPKPKKRDWNALVRERLEAGLASDEPKATHVAAATTGAAPADAILLAAAVAKFGKEPSTAQSETKAPPKRGNKKSGTESVEPTDLDVLLGRGGRTNNNAGNKRYLEVKDTMQARYLAADKNSKTPISQELVDIVHAWGGRFLKLDQSTNTWFEIDNTAARKKCSQTLREINTPEERAAKRARYSKS